MTWDFSPAGPSRRHLGLPLSVVPVSLATRCRVKNCSRGLQRAMTHSCDYAGSNTTGTPG
jgi:hypothetical protein